MLAVISNIWKENTWMNTLCHVEIDFQNKTFDASLSNWSTGLNDQQGRRKVWKFGGGGEGGK